MKLLLVNPNTNAETTEIMRGLAAEAAPAGVEVEGLTVARGPPLLTHPLALSAAGSAVLGVAGWIRGRGVDGVIVGAFGDPGRDGLAARLSVPVVGLGSAGLRAGGLGGRRFAVVTTTPELVSSIREMVERLGLGDRFAGVSLTEGDATATTTDAAGLPRALAEASRRAISQWGVTALVIGGGPLCAAARGLAFPGVSIVDPIVAAVREVTDRMGEGRRSRPPLP